MSPVASAPANSPHILVDDRLWPIVIMDYVGDLSEAEWMSIFPIYQDFYTRRERFQVLNDNTCLGSFPGAKLRGAMAEKAREVEDLQKRYLLASAVVFSNPLARGALTALNWLAPPSYKQTIHATRLDAYRQLLRNLEEHRMPVTDAMRAHEASFSGR